MHPPRAGFWIRVAASLLDVLVLLPLIGVYFAVFYYLDARNRLTPEMDQLLLVAFLLCTEVYTTFEIWRAATPGKMILRLRIRDRAGDEADGWRLAHRWVVKTSGSLVSTGGAALGLAVVERLGDVIDVFVAIGCLFVLRESRLAWHDQLTGTAVYRLKDLEVQRGFTPLVGEAGE